MTLTPLLEIPRVDGKTSYVPAALVEQVRSESPSGDRSPRADVLLTSGVTIPAAASAEELAAAYERARRLAASPA